MLALILIPLSRAVVKHLLNHYGLWKKQTIIMGSSKNAQEAWQALQSEEVMVFDVIAFYDVEGTCPQASISGVPVLRDASELWNLTHCETQFIVAVEFEKSQYRNVWLKNLRCITAVQFPLSRRCAVCRFTAPIWPISSAMK